MDDAKLDALLQAVAEQEKAELGEHPSPEELLEYSQGTLLEEEKEPIRDHLTLCSTCADLVLDFNAFPDLEAPPGAPPLSEHELARQRRALEQAARALDDAVTPSSQAPAWTMWVGWVVAAACFATLILSWWTFHLQQTPAPGVRADVVVATLGSSEEAPERTATPQRIALPPWAGRVSLRLRWDELTTLPRYRIELVGPAGRVIWAEAGAHRGPDGDFHLLLERGMLEAGRHRIRLFAGEAGGEPLATYPFEVVFE